KTKCRKLASTRVFEVSELTQPITAANKQKSSGQRRRPRGRPKQEDVALIEAGLLSVALGEFIRRGYGAASLTQIIKIAGVSKTTFYSRYSSKAELFQAIMQEQIKRIAPATAL